MRYLYGDSDEKFIKSREAKRKDINPLASFKFRLNPIIEGKTDEFDRTDVPIVFKCTPDTLLNLCVKVVDAMPLPMVYTWTIEDICKWLRACGYKQYQNTFRANLITGHNLLLLNASALSAMNIKDFDHIKDITRSIRTLFHFEMTKFARSLTLYPEFHNELYKLFRLKTGGKYENVRRSELWRKMQLIRQKEPNYSHWELLERWLAFEKDPKSGELFGNVPRSKLYTCKLKSSNTAVAIKHSERCLCLPPCECYWSNLDRRPPWRFKCLPHLAPDSEFVEVCRNCIPPCTCRWSSRKYLTRGVLTCLQRAFPQKYGGLEGQNSYRRLDQFSSYRLSIF
ncbi:hypothetical protein FF38_06840 [Lucilia cuprina]|uniref:SAM domain-containing protein n=1 Tax=Lucilia cuprina TaxID=7375 RepID=A0A0L0CMS4_LUCCU|nr:Sterile alpha motif domain-containing protein 15 [Lucilia cuprina]KNC33581.1 hypothetical protein FF38_06840 [Lucilia cuprina]